MFREYRKGVWCLESLEREYDRCLESIEREYDRCLESI